MPKGATMLDRMDAERKRRAEIGAARKALRVCREDRDVLLSRYPDHAEARRMYDAKLTELTATLDRLLRA